MTKPRLILLVRHGESESNCDKNVNRYTPNHQVCLTERGEQQATLAGLQLRSILKPDDSILFYQSPYKRARQTCDNIINGIKDTDVAYKVHEEPRMREQDFGNFQSNPEEMEKIWAERAHYGHFFYRIPFGESAADVYDRCAGFNETLFRQFQADKFPSVLVLVTHGIWARVFLMKWFRWSVEEFESLTNIPHCQFIVMEKNLETERYKLKTKMRKWTDADEEEVEIELTDELKFHSQDKISAGEIKKIIDAEKEAIRGQKIKQLASIERFINEKAKFIADSPVQSDLEA